MSFALRLLVPLLVLSSILAAGCAAGPAVAPSREIAVETTAPLLVNTGRREVRVEVDASDTLVSFGEARIACLGHRGYLGRVAVERGFLRVGRIELSWEGDMLRLRTPSGWRVIQLGERTNLFVEQDGTTGRNVFRD